jgi:hypothetical protein
MDKEPMETNASYQAALQISQEAIAKLIQWSEGMLRDECILLPEPLPAVSRAKALLKWDSAEVGLLRLLFDSVSLSTANQQEHYHCLQAIADSKPWLTDKTQVTKL